MNDFDLNFNLPLEEESIIKVVGVGGGGSNAVSHMYAQGIVGVNFIICNTDEQALETSTVPTKIQLGPSKTEGRGAGSLPEIGKMSAQESEDDVKSILCENTKMVFVTAGMGGGTGTGGAPVVAQIAKESDILTVGIVTVPFSWEGPRRKKQAEAGIDEMKKHVDTLIVISNDKLREMYGELTLSDAFAKADDVLATAAKGIAEIITVAGKVNVDFADVKTVMQNSGVAIMGSGIGSGDDRALDAVQMALNSPLLNDSEIKGAKHVLLNITSDNSKEATLTEVDTILRFVQEKAGNRTDVIWGSCKNDSMGDNIAVTLIATGFETEQEQEERIPIEKEKETTFYDLNEQPKASINITEEVMEEVSTAPVAETPPPAQQPKPPVSVQPPVIRTPEPKIEPQPVVPPTPVVPPVAETKVVNIQKQKPTPPPPKVSEEEPFIMDLDSDETSNPSKKSEVKADLERLKQALNRKRKLQKMHYKMHSAAALNELERTPAYKRQKVELKEVSEANESEISSYDLMEDGKVKDNGNDFFNPDID